MAPGSAWRACGGRRRRLKGRLKAAPPATAVCASGAQSRPRRHVRLACAHPSRPQSRACLFLFLRVTRTRPRRSARSPDNPVLPNANHGSALPSPGVPLPARRAKNGSAPAPGTRPYEASPTAAIGLHGDRGGAKCSKMICSDRPTAREPRCGRGSRHQPKLAPRFSSDRATPPNLGRARRRDRGPGKSLAAR